MESEYSAEEWRRIGEEFTRLKDTTYLDHAGATLYSERQLADVYRLLGTSLIGNPHTTKQTEDLIDQVRYRILAAFNAPDDEYTVIFTSGATAALRTVAESFVFDAEESSKVKADGGRFYYLSDNHTSVLGMRTVVQTEHSHSIPHREFRTALQQEQKQRPGPAEPEDPTVANSLFVLPGQCNFSGYKYPLTTAIPMVQRRGPAEMPNRRCNWYVMLDAASLAATSEIDLRRYRPDFMCISFYKLFGYPTGLGALLVSRRGERVLRKRYFGGGTVQIAMASRDWHVPRQPLHERFEDGTVSFLAVASLLAGYDTVERLVPAAKGRSTWARISQHCFEVARHLYRNLAALSYANGTKVVQLYHDTEFESAEVQGGIVTFNVLTDMGSVVGFRELAEIAAMEGVLLRTGCFCNPGACQRHLRLSDTQVLGHFNAGHVCGDLMDLIAGVPTGSVRISVGYMTTIADVDRVVRLIRRTYMSTAISRALRQPASPQPSSPSLRLRQICVYPIKSCAAHRVAGAWPLTGRGLLYDREWMIVNGRTGCALTQKTNTRMCLLQPLIDRRGDMMLLRFPHHRDCPLPVRLGAVTDGGADEPDFAGTLCQSKVCGDRIVGYDCGDQIADWLAEVLCEPDVRLIRQAAGEDARRQKRADKRDVKPGAAISLANTAQFLLINTASVDWLMDEVEAWTERREELSADEERLLQQNTIDRFRGNLIVEDAGQLEELQWRRLRVGAKGVAFTVQGPCTRCQMICIDQASGEKTAEPLHTIARVFGGKMRFGVYLEYEAGKREAGEDEVLIRCGDEVWVE